MKFRHVHWQRNLLRVPPEVRAKLDAEPNVEFLVGVVRSIPIAKIKAGDFRHLGITADDDPTETPTRIMPLAEMGRYSYRNRKGWEVVRDDLPKTTRTFTYSTPNWGDWSKGSHLTWQTRDVYQRDYYEPPELEIVVERLRVGSSEQVFKFIVDFALDQKSHGFDDDLLFALNLLQENVGAVGLLSKTGTSEELLAPLNLDWEVFPPGTVDDVVRRMVGTIKKPTKTQEGVIRDRVALFNSLKPKKFIQGHGGLNRYIGAMFADDLVVFENVRYGNALYVLYDNWTDVSQRSRVDLLRTHDAPFDRFVHGDGWTSRFLKHMKTEKHRRGLG